MKKPAEEFPKYTLTVDTSTVKKELDILLSKLKEIKKLEKEIGLKK